MEKKVKTKKINVIPAGRIIIKSEFGKPICQCNHAKWVLGDYGKGVCTDCHL